MPEFLPVSRADMAARGWEQCDFVYVIGDAYVDHPSFGHAIISRVLEAAGYKVGILSQPDWKDPKSVCALGRPRLGFLVTGGNMDSMVNHYSVSHIICQSCFAWQETHNHPILPVWPVNKAFLMHPYLHSPNQ